MDLQTLMDGPDQETDRNQLEEAKDFGVLDSTFSNVFLKAVKMCPGRVGMVQTRTSYCCA